MSRTTTLERTDRAPMLHAPQPGIWQVLPGTSTVGISGRASRLAPTVRATFSGVRGELVVDADPDRSQVSVEIDLASLSTGNPVYDDVLKRADPFRTDRHPDARFRSTEVRWDLDHVGVAGVLELAGRTAALTLQGTYTETRPGVAELTASGVVGTAILGRVALPGASFLVPSSMKLAVRVVARHGCAAA